jgi:(2S)-methylsuccinyl-CoA dehydrogenase
MTPPRSLSSVLTQAAQAASALVEKAVVSVAALVTLDGKVNQRALDREQLAVHGLAWYATYAAVFNQVTEWERRIHAAGTISEMDQWLASALILEYAQQLMGGVAMSQQEIARPADLGLDDSDVARFSSGGWKEDLRSRLSPDNRARAIQALLESRAQSTVETTGLDDDLQLIRDQFRAFADEQVVPFAHGWHLADALIPLEIVDQLGALGVFGLTIPERFGGAGLGKMAMCVVSEELTRGYIGVGSLATRAEIAAELILNSGTQAQKDFWLPIIASGAIVPTAAFTEPDTGSDLASVRTRARRDGNRYLVTGNKNWITHAARADLMTLLVRTNPSVTDHRGLSMLLAPKTRMRSDCHFPDVGLTGGEIPVLGYRGMKEYALGFDEFCVPADSLLGGVEGLGFRQLMATFESARIQTAARAIGVAQSSFEAGLDYAIERRQFGRTLFEYPRVHNKLLMMAAEMLGARQLTYFAARTKDAGTRCDLEAGMAKLLAARIAWAAADGALQIHGGNGFALEYPISRLLCDARVLSIFEGASEIQAQVIAKRLLEQRGVVQ